MVGGVCCVCQNVFTADVEGWWLLMCMGAGACPPIIAQTLARAMYLVLCIRLEPVPVTCMRVNIWHCEVRVTPCAARTCTEHAWLSPCSPVCTEDAMAAGIASGLASGMVSGLTSGIASSLPSGIETPEHSVNLRKGAESSEPRPLYTVLEQRAAPIGQGTLLGTDHVYVIPGGDKKKAAGRCVGVCGLGMGLVGVHGKLHRVAHGRPFCDCMCIVAVVHWSNHVYDC